MENSNQTMPNNNMGLAIVGTILGLCPTLCCINAITGGIAIYFASQVKKKFEAGDFSGAEQAAKNAKILAWVSIGLFIASIIWSIVTYDPVAQQEQMEQIQEMLEQFK